MSSANKKVMAFILESSNETTDFFQFINLCHSQYLKIAKSINVFFFAKE
jgi:hypothetical protein